MILNIHKEIDSILDPKSSSGYEMYLQFKPKENQELDLKKIKDIFENYIQTYSIEFSRIYPISMEEKPLQKHQNIHVYKNNRVILKNENLKTSYYNASEYVLGNEEGTAILGVQPNHEEMCEQFFHLILEKKVEEVFFYQVFDEVKAMDFTKKGNIGSFVLVCKEVEKNSSCVTYTIHLTHEGKTHQFSLHVFVKWPDFGVPKDEDLPFLKKLIMKGAASLEQKKTIFIGCNAGVGRTGVAICSTISLFFKENPILLLPKIVIYLRRYVRPMLVQTEDQLQLIYQLVQMILGKKD